MFDIGWLELGVCGFIALFFLKKEDIRSLFYRLGQLKQYLNKIRVLLNDEVVKELELDEIKQRLRNESILSSEAFSLPKDHDNNDNT